MKIYDSLDELSAAIGLPVLEPSTDDRTGGAPAESDWGFRLRGLGLPGGMPHGGWLLTFARKRFNSSTGHLIAYEISPQNIKTGRCALLRSPWDEETNDSERARTYASPIWSGSMHDLGGEADLAAVDDFVAEQR